MAAGYFAEVAMDTKLPSKTKGLWIAGLVVISGWHVSRSLGQAPPTLTAMVTVGAADSMISSAQPQAAGWVSSPALTVSATPASAATVDWPGLAAAAKGELRGDRLPQPTLAKQAVVQAADELHALLSTARDERYANWLVFLRWNDLQQQLSASEVDIDQLIQIERNMRQNYLGLELPAFTRLRQAISQYVSALLFGQDPTSDLQAISQRLDQLAANLTQPAQDSDMKRQREAGFVASMLHQSRQAPAFLQSVRGQFSRPNVRVLASRDFVHRRFARPVSEPKPVDEVILGTRILGHSLLSGQVTPHLLNDPRQASLQLILHGQLHSQNTGLNRGVKIFTQGDADITASESISLTDRGLISRADTSVSAALASRITGIDHRLRLVERIASKKAAQQKPMADAIARSKLERRVANEFHQQLLAQLEETNRTLQDQSQPPALSRLGLASPKRTSWSSSDYLAVLWQQQAEDQLAAPASCPLVVQPQGLTIQVHQSLITNLLDPVIGGRVIRNRDLDDWAIQFKQTPSEELKKEAAGEAWSIAMAGYHPVEVEFDDQKVYFRIRTTKLDRGDQALEQKAIIEAAYAVELQGGALQLRRQGGVKIEFSGELQRGLRAVTLRSFLKNKFDTVFKEELLEQPVRLSDRLPANAPDLEIVEVQMDDGWLQATLM
jgi:hypothetical protein